MKHIKTIIITAITPVLFVACANQGGIGSLSTGQDSVAMNATRGSAAAQISKAQADQYKRQQDLVSGELDLDQKKRAATTQGIDSTLGTVRNVFGTVMGIARSFR